MFRNSQLLRRSNQVKGSDGEQDSRPVAILADPYEAEAGILVPVLNKFGFRVFEARDGAAALELARQHVTSLVIASADMPHISGAQLCQKVRERNGLSTPFILISPKDSLPDKFAGHETFASDYAQRPLNLQEFESRLSAVLRAHRAGEDQGTPEPLPAAKVFASLRQAERAAPIPPPPPNDRIIEDVKEVGLVVAPIETETIDTLLTPEYLTEHDVRKEGAILYREAFVFLSSAIQAAEKGDRIAMDVGFDIAKRFVSSLYTDKSLMMLATDRTTIFSFRQHSVNVAIIGTRIAQTLRLPEDRQVRVCLAGMLHDLGNVKLPRKLTSKHSGFTASERSEMQRRPVYSAEMASGYTGYEWLPKIILQVYERENGSGYPYGIRSKEISEESRILGVADIFEACIHRRPQRAAMTGYRALEVITAEFDSFGERTTKAMIRSFSVYPFNELVVLNTGEIGKVIDINAENPLRPIVRLIYSVDRVEMRNPRVVDLARNSQLWITSAITPDELPTGGR
jgi:HD-GYP domain-containing protein (c-di-GMP phosphodiesterase class II)